MSEASPEDGGGGYGSAFALGASAASVDDEDGVDFNPEDYSEMAAALSEQPDDGDPLSLGQGAGQGAATTAAARSLAVSAAIKVLDTQLYVVRGLAVAAIRAGQAVITARNKVTDARAQLAARLLSSRLRAMRSAKLRALDAVVRIGLAMSRSLGSAGVDAADASRDVLVTAVAARLQAIRSVAEAGLTLGRTLLQDLLGLPPS
ncbi:hypothetical protein ONE63_008326 [Megalurothrips usitatus]|uniref:Biogenesis of lysosome-related organelles complex 1 subunit 3 n=1 Tax=Megalurothrips usitatus TaxID=439358 RepID=A0AAV7XSN2_9NEOP|nr:hypothetical protein ONE63_008326 [Megalurothrips usitatus]